MTEQDTASASAGRPAMPLRDSTSTAGTSGRPAPPIRENSGRSAGPVDLDVTSNSLNSSIDPAETMSRLVNEQQLNVSAASAAHGDEDVNVFVQSMLEDMTKQFDQMGKTILGRIDDMGGRIDELETTIGELMNQAGVEPPTGTLPGSIAPSQGTGTGTSVTLEGESGDENGEGEF